MKKSWICHSTGSPSPAAFRNVCRVFCQPSAAALIKTSMSIQKTVYGPEATDYVCPVSVLCIEIWPPTLCVLQTYFVFPSSLCTVYFPKSMDPICPASVPYIEIWPPALCVLQTSFEFSSFTFPPSDLQVPVLHIFSTF